MSLGARESAARESHAHVSLADLLAMPAMTGGGLLLGCLIFLPSLLILF